MRAPASLATLLLPLLLFPLLAAALPADPPPERPARAEERRGMIAAIEGDVRATRRYIGKEALNEAVLEAMARVPRHEFVPEEMAPYAYQNRPLPIGHGQTISQPYIVALMTDLLELEADDVVLEVGTGSGYQAAVLAELVKKVYTLEIIAPLETRARQRLARLGYDNIEVIGGDGYHGWPAAAPYDAIIVTAAAAHIPPPLVAQLEPGGKMVIPVGGRFLTQQLTIVEKGTGEEESKGERVRTRQLLPVQFVPLTGEH